MFIQKKSSKATEVETLLLFERSKQWRIGDRIPNKNGWLTLRTNENYVIEFEFFIESRTSTEDKLFSGKK